MTRAPLLALAAAALTAALSVTACATAGDPAPGAVPPRRSAGRAVTPPPAAVVRWAELNGELAGDIAQAGRTCAQVARAVRAFVAKNGKEYGTLLKDVARWERQADERSVDHFYRRAFPDLDARIDAGIRCKDDSQARAAYDQFFASAGLDTR